MESVVWDKSGVTTGLLAVLVTIAVGAILVEMRDVMLPFIIAVYVSYIFKPIVIFLKKRNVPTFVGLIVVLLTVAALLFGMSMIIYSSVDSFVQELPKYQTKLESLIDALVVQTHGIAAQLDVNLYEMDWKDTVSLASVTAFASTSAGTFLEFLTNSLLILLFMMFILAGSGDMTKKISEAFQDSHSHKIAAIIESIDVKVRQYLVTKTIISLATGGISTIILLIAGVDFALLWGFIIFLLNYIPNIGSIIGTMFPILISLLQFDGIGTAVLLLILLGGTQFIMGNVVEPRIMAFSLNLSPVLVLVALVMWGWIWGVWGMILSVPIMSTLKIIMEHIEPLRPLAHIMGGNSGKKPKNQKISEQN